MWPYYAIQRLYCENLNCNNNNATITSIQTFTIVALSSTIGYTSFREVIILLLDKGPKLQRAPGLLDECIIHRDNGTLLYRPYQPVILELT